MNGIEGLGLPEDGMTMLHHLVMNVRSLCADTLFQCAAKGMPLRYCTQHTTSSFPHHTSLIPHLTLPPCAPCRHKGAAQVGGLEGARRGGGTGD